MARILPISDPSARTETAEHIKRGGLVAFPTETVYGLGADAFNPDAVARIFEAKERPSFDPLIVHLSDIAQTVLVAEPDARVLRLAQRFWPGPLTIILHKRDHLPDIVTAGLDTVAVRIPDHADTRAWLSACGVPVAAPSANPFGYVSPTTAAHVDEQLGAKIDYVLDGGPARVGVESTILSLVSDPPAILRPGAILAEDLRPILGKVVLCAGSDIRPQAPGRLERHYATRTPLVLLAPGEDARAHAKPDAALLTFKPRQDVAGFGEVECLAPDGLLNTAAARLFAVLRRLDSLGLSRLVAESVPEQGLGIAIMDRLRRCATP